MINNNSEPRHFGCPARLDASAFKALCMQKTDREHYPLANRIISNVPVYSGQQALTHISAEGTRQHLQDEWHHCLLEGPGVLVIQGMYADTRVIDDATQSFLEIIEEERVSGGRGDHFAPAGSNDRIWNAFQKHGLRSPESFTAYYSNPLLALVSEAWLGPFYQVTSQVNVVNPGEQAQSPHRDYHLGFQPSDIVSRFPLSMHVASQLLTLQGAIAHSDMPVEAGPTQLLPYSQTYREGYMAWRDPAFRKVFNEHYVQLPLAKGDGVFFNPALFHAAGSNRSADCHRMANLLQISSAFGRAMETVDCRRLVEANYKALCDHHTREGMSAAVQAFIAAVAEGYAFPANLDKTPPQGGMAPETQQQLLRRALEESWPVSKLRDCLQQQDEARLS